MRKLALLTAVTVTLCAQFGFAQPADELEALRKDIGALKDRHTANLKELQGIKSLMGQNPKDEEARRPLAETGRGAAGGGLDDRQRAALVRALAAQPAGTPVWFAVYEQDPAARDLGRALQAAFGEAGWIVRGMQEVAFNIKPGVYLFAADVEPPAYVQTAQEALGLAGIRLTVGTGYRSYYAEMRTKPEWRGFEMASNQTYLVVVGPVAQRSASQAARSGAAPAPPGTSKLLAWALAAVVLLTAAVGGAWHFFFRSRPAAEAEPAPEASPTDPAIGPTAERP